MNCGRAAGVNCAEVLDRLYEFIDKELDEAYWSKLQQHLDECAPCLSRVDLERVVKSLVARSCCEQAPVELRQRVIFSIRQEQLWHGQQHSPFEAQSPFEGRPPFAEGY